MTSTTQKTGMRKPGAERGNIFFMLFGAVAVVGVLGAATVSLMRGPLSTMVEVNRRTLAESQMSIASKLGMMTSALQANSGDCEAVPDGFVEPYEWEAAGNAGPDGVTGSEGGGWLSGAYGVSKKDPWGTNYGYCVWDAGATVADAGCGGAGQKRLAGSGNGDRTYPVMALISAGPDRTFQTGCVSFATGDTNNSGTYDAGEKLVVKAPGSDDVVLEYTYAEASVTAGGLWELKTGAPDTAQTPKNIEVGGGANFAGGSALIDPTTGQGTFPRVVTDFAQPNTAPTIDFVSGLKLTNTGTVGANCSTGSGGPGLGTLAVDSATSTALLGCLDDSGTPKWFALGGVNTDKWKDGTDAGDIHYPGGFVGIGVVDPDRALEVAGDASLTGDFFLADTKSVRWGDATTRIQGSGPGSLEFLTGGSTRFTMDSSGLAGLGVAPAASTRLIIQGTGDTSATVALNVTDSNAATILYVQDDKKVGIGTTPNDALDVAGAADVSMGYKIDGNTVVYVPDTVVENILVGKDAGVLVTGDNNTVVGGSAAAVLAAGTDNIVVGQGAAELLDSGNFNTLIGQGIGPTLTTGERNILIGSHDTVPVDTLLADTDDYLNIGNTIYGHMDTDKIGIGVPDPTEALDVSGNVKATGDVSGANLIAGSSVMVGTDIVGPVSTCSGANKLQYSGGNWVCSPDLQGGSGAGTPPNLEDVLSNGDDANGQDARDLGTVAIGSGTVSGTLKLDVSGNVGATQYCDEDGANCFTAASVGSIDTFLELVDTPAAYTGAGSWLVRVNAGATGLEFIDPATLSTSAAGNTGEVQFNNGGVFAASANLFWDNAVKELGIGTNAPGASLDVATTDAILFPRGTTAEQPATPVNGMMRYNSTANKFEVRENGSWRYLQTGTSTSLAYTDLSDTPAVYTGAAYKLAMVNPTQTGMIFSYNDAVLLPVGLTADRPATPVDGMIRYNSETAKFEVRQAGAWVNMVSAATPPGGSDREVQFNNSGALGANANFVYTATGYLGVGTADPKAPFHVTGEAIIGPTSGLACDADRAGGIRYNAGGTYLEYCDGTAWRPLIGSASGTVLTITPAADTGMDVTGPGSPATGATVNFIVTNVGDTTSSALSYTITGLNPSNFVVTGENCTGATLAASATCQISIQPQTSSNGLYSATLTVPEHNAPFASLQGTGSGFGCVEGQAAYGGMIAKCDAFGAGKHFIVTPGGCTNSTTPTCAGGNDTTAKAWSNVNANDVSSLAGSTADGPQNTVNLMQLHNAGGTAPAFYHAAAYCADMNYGGYTDWYLPAGDELLNFFYPNRVAVGGYVSAEYWASRQGGISYGIAMAADGTVNGYSFKSAAYRVRCARREGMTEPAAVPDTTPESTVVFPTAFAASAGVRTSSSVVTVTGITPGTAVSVSGSGSPTIKINGGAEVTSGTVKWNDTVQVVMDSPAIGTRSEASVTIGTATLPFSVITRGNCGGSCAGVDKRVFVTSTSFNGNFGGVGGGDTKCQQYADAASLGGTWRAVISGSASGDWAVHRMDYNWDRLVNMNGQVIATSPADLWDGSINNSISYDENVVVRNVAVWSGADSSSLGRVGESINANCVNWTSSNGAAWGFSSDTGNNWLGSLNFSGCISGLRHLYCAEVTAPGVTLAITPAIQNSMDVTGPGAPATGSAVTFTVENTGTGASAPLAMSMDNVTNFEIMNDTCTGTILAAAATCTLDVRPRAYANGTYSGVLSAASSGAPTATAALDGTASSFLYTAGQWYLGVDPGDIYYSDGPVGIGTNDPDVSLDIVGTDAIRIPVGTTAQQPVVPLAGMMRYNSTTNLFEGYVDDGTPAWEPINTGAGGLWTDLTGGRIHYGTTNANMVGVGIADPKAPLHVAGEAIIGPTSGLACDADRTGGMRWSAANTCLEACDGTTWTCIVKSVCDEMPAFYNFTDQTGLAQSTLTESNILAVTGLDSGCNVDVSVSGDGAPEYRICADAACSSEVQTWTAANGSYDMEGRYVQLRSTTQAADGATNTVSLSIGIGSDNWLISTLDPNACDAAGPGDEGMVCADGTIFAGMDPVDGTSRLFTSRCDAGQTWDGSACTGVRSSVRWNNGNSTGVINTAVSDCTAPCTGDDGRRNTTLLNVVDADSGPAGIQPHQAAAYCAGLSANGQSDWYLPELPALNVLYLNSVSLGNFTTGTPYWSSSEYGGSTAWRQDFGSGGYADVGKYNASAIRCVRSTRACDVVPNAFTVPDRVNLGTSVLTTSNIVAISGVSGGCGATVSVSGGITPEYRVCNDSTCSSVLRDWGSAPLEFDMNGKYIQVRDTSSASLSTTTTVTVDIGGVTDTWSLTTGDGDCSAAGPGDEGKVCADGTVFAGMDPVDGTSRLFTSRCDAGMTWDGSACTGTAGGYAWNNGTVNYVDTPVMNCGSAPCVGDDGRAITTMLDVTDSDSVVAGAQPHQAAAYCAGLSASGQTDWYLPAIPEQNVLYNNKGVIGIGTAVYHASSELSSTDGWRQNFNTGAYNVDFPTWKKNQAFYRVRCVRSTRACDIVPNAFTVPDRTNVGTSTLLESGIVAISGVSGGCGAAVSVSGGTTPEYRVCNDSTCTTIIRDWGSAPLEFDMNGKYIQLRDTTSGSLSTTTTTTVSIGGVTDTWSLTTGDGDCSAAGPGDEGKICADGTVYAGDSPAGGRMFVPRCDGGRTWDGSTCSGSRLSTAWNNGNGSNYVDTSLTNCEAAPCAGTADGSANTATLAATDSDSGVGGTQPHAAAVYCDGLSLHGHTDWYLPSLPELGVIVLANNPDLTNGTGDDNTLGDFAMTTYYWSSSETNSTHAWLERPSDGNQSYLTKNNGNAVRCARRDGDVALGFTPASGVNMDVAGPGAPAYGSTVTFTLTNTGTATSGLLSSSLTNSANFEITADTCAGNTLAASATCTIDVRPVASADGNYSGSLVVTHPAGSVAAGLSGVASGFGSAVVGYWTAGVDVGDIFYSDGPVGIGTNDPDVPLDVVGKIRGDVLALRDVTGAAAPVNAIPDVLNDLSDVNAPAPAANDVLTWDGTEWIAQAAGSGTGALTVPRGTTAQRPGTPVNGMIRYNTTVEAFEVYENGAWVAMGAAVSDVRLKTDIVPLDRAAIVDKIMQVNTYSFRLKADQTGRENMGVIAQEIEKIFPDLVDGEGEAIRSVHYVELIAPLIETAQYLKIENDTMKADVSELKDQVALLNKAAIGNTGKASMDGWAMLLLGLLLGGNAVLLVRFGRRRKA